jgi:two-component system response regulator MprA
VLLVEDDGPSARVLVKMLREDGFDVDLATDGAAAIGRLARSPLPDALVTDLHMPSVDGASIARYGRSRCSALPVIIVTGYPQRLAPLERELVPPPHVLTKPLDYPVLLAVLEAVVGAPVRLRAT